MSRLNKILNSCKYNIEIINLSFILYSHTYDNIIDNKIKRLSNQLVLDIRSNYLYDIFKTLLFVRNFF